MVTALAPIAQSAERLHGKEKVKGSIPFRGSLAQITDLGNEKRIYFVLLAFSEAFGARFVGQPA